MVYEEIRKKYSFFVTEKTSIFISRGTLSKLTSFDFLYFLIEEKNFVSILKNIYFFTRVFSFFHHFPLRFISTQPDLIFTPHFWRYF